MDALRDKYRFEYTGHLLVRVYDRNENEISVLEGDNLVVASAKDMLAQLVGGGDASKVMTYIAVGIDPAQAQVSDSTVGGLETTNLVTGVNMGEATPACFVKALTGVTYPESNTPSFTFTLDYDEANGMDINDFGLLSQDMTLFSRRVQGPITKDSGIRMSGTWTIEL